MMLALVLSVSLLGQQSLEVEGLAPYEFVMKNSGEVVYAYVDPAKLGEVSIPVVFDEPWNRLVRFETIPGITIAESNEELPSVHQGRVNRLWEEAGGVQVRDRAGRRYWVYPSDQAKSEAAGALYAAAFPPAPATVDEVDEPELQPANSVAGPGFIRLWGMHVAVVGGVAIGAAATIWWALRKPWSAV